MKQKKKKKKKSSAKAQQIKRSPAMRDISASGSGNGQLQPMSVLLNGSVRETH